MHFQRETDKLLVCLGRRSFQWCSGRVEAAVVARTKKCFVCRLPINLAAEMGTDIGESDKVLCESRVSRAGDKNGLSGWRDIGKRHSFFQFVHGSYKQPTACFFLRVQILKNNGDQLAYGSSSTDKKKTYQSFGNKLSPRDHIFNCTVTLLRKQ